MTEMEYYNSGIAALMKSGDTRNSEGTATPLSKEKAGVMFNPCL